MHGSQKNPEEGLLKPNLSTKTFNMNKNFKIHSLAETQAELKSSSQKILRNKSAAKIIERQPASGGTKAPFFQTVAFQTKHWMGEDNQSQKTESQHQRLAHKPAKEQKDFYRKGFRLGSAATSAVETRQAELSQTESKPKLVNLTLVEHMKRHLSGHTSGNQAIKRTMSANVLVKGSPVQSKFAGIEGQHARQSSSNYHLTLAINQGERNDLDSDRDQLHPAQNEATQNRGFRAARPQTAKPVMVRPSTAVSSGMSLGGENFRLQSASTFKAQRVNGRLDSATAPHLEEGSRRITAHGVLAEDSREEESSDDLFQKNVQQKSVDPGTKVRSPPGESNAVVPILTLKQEVDPLEQLRVQFLKNPKTVVEENYTRMKNLAAMLNITQTERERTREEMLDQARKKTDPRMFKGRYADFEPVMPWEKVSIYRDGEPEYNNPAVAMEYEPEPVIEIKPEKELEIRNLMEGLYEKFDFYKKYTNIEYDSECKYLKVEPAKLALYEVNRVRKQYANKASRQPFDLDMVEEIVRPLPFFMKFDSEVRKQILEKAELVEYPVGHTVFKQGDYGDKMYIILQGSVNVVIHYNDPITAKPMSRVVAWMRDGSSFGEYSMLGSKSRTIKDTVFTSMSKLSSEINNRLIYLKRAIIYQEPIDLKEKSAVEAWKKKKAEELQQQNDPLFQKNTNEQQGAGYQERTKRAADIVATENLFMLELSREYFREIILTTIKDEYERKMRLLSELPLFKVHELLSLMPIANFMQRREYKLGEVIQLQGNQMDGMTVIFQGRCKVVLIVTHTRKNEVTSYVRGLKQKQPNLNFGNKARQTKHVDEDLPFVKLQKAERAKKERRTLTRQFTFTDDEALILEDKNKLLHYEDHILVNIIERGTLFGFRTAKMFLMDMKSAFDAVEHKLQPARLSIIAETHKVVAYHFDIKNFKYLPEEVKRTILQAARDSKDYDDEDIDDIRKKGDHWDKYKEYIYLKTAAEQFHKRRQEGFKDY